MPGLTFTDWQLLLVFVIGLLLGAGLMWLARGALANAFRALSAEARITGPLASVTVGATDDPDTPFKLCIGFPPSRSGIFSAGNGPAMRAAILGVYAAHDHDRLAELIQASTTLTHTDPDAEYGALAVALAAVFAALGPFIDWAAVFNVHSDVAVREVDAASRLAITLFLLGFPLALLEKIFASHQDGAVGTVWSGLANVASLVALILVTRTHGGMSLLVGAVSGTDFTDLMQGWCRKKLQNLEPLGQFPPSRLAVRRGDAEVLRFDHPVGTGGDAQRPHGLRGHRGGAG